MRSSVWSLLCHGMPRGRGRARTGVSPPWCSMGPPARIVRAYKDGGERRLSTEIACIMHRAAREAELTVPARYGGLLSRVDAVTFVPVTSSAYRRRGFDHMEAIARDFADASCLPLIDALVKTRLARPARIGARRKTCSLTRAIRGGRSGWWYAGPAAGRRHYHGRHHERRRPRAQMRRSRACRLPCIRPRVVMCKNAPVPFYTPLATCGIMPRSSFQAVVAGARERKTPRAS